MKEPLANQETEKEKREGSKAVSQAGAMHVGENKSWKHEKASKHLGFWVRCIIAQYTKYSTLPCSYSQYEKGRNAAM